MVKWFVENLDINNHVCYIKVNRFIHVYAIGALIYRNAYFGQGSGPILFSDVSCNGNESCLESCGFSSNPYSSSHSTDVGVKCLERGIIYVSSICLCLIID